MQPVIVTWRQLVIYNVLHFGSDFRSHHWCLLQTCQGIRPWYQAWLFRLVPLSFSSSSSCFFRFSDGGSNQNFSLENWKGITGGKPQTGQRITWVHIISVWGGHCPFPAVLKRKKLPEMSKKRAIVDKSGQPAVVLSALCVCVCMWIKTGGWGQRMGCSDIPTVASTPAGTRGPNPRPMLESWPRRHGNVIVRNGSSLSGAFVWHVFMQTHTRKENKTKRKGKKEKRKTKILYIKSLHRAVPGQRNAFSFWTHTRHCCYAVV